MARVCACTGVGKYTAKKIYEPPHNLRSIAELRAAIDAAAARGEPALLDRRATIGLRYFEDLDSEQPGNRIPCAEIEAIVKIVRAAAVRKHHFLRHFTLKQVTLPRQAQDKHRRNCEKTCIFLQETVVAAAPEGLTVEVRGMYQHIPCVSHQSVKIDPK